MSHYSISKTVSLSFSDAIDAVKAAAQAKGFGTLVEIDMKQKFHDVLGKNIDEYVILGVCHPPSAFEAISAEQEIGLLLPCNIIVHKKEGMVIVSAIRPSIAMSFVQNQKLKPLAIRVEKTLEDILFSLS